MSFFNSKEEVLDIELTPYGKYLLSKGKWKPAYYEFYDDDIIYDSNFSFGGENQSEINQRIKSQPREKVQYSFAGAETRLKEYKKQLSSEETPKGQHAFLEKRKTLYTSFLPLGYSSLDKDLYPSFKLNLIAGEITSFSNGVSIAGVPNNLNIVNLKTENYILFKDSNEEEEFINFRESEILIDVEELFTGDSSENFEISIFQEHLVSGSLVEGEQLFFEDVQERNKVINNLLEENLDFEDYNNKKQNKEFFKTNFANYFLDIKLDKEIEQDTLCKYLSKEQLSKLKIVYGYDINCEEYQEAQSLSPGRINILDSSGHTDET